ncbi:MAG: potassium channel family protein, partial [Thermoanaerobaculia bacterium]
MRRSRKWLLIVLLSLPLLVLVSAVIYMMGMSLLEGKPRTFWESVEWASETLTTTGYGADNRWRHPVMVLFVMVAQMIGVFLVYLIFPLYLIPLLEERFETRLPQEAPKDLQGHAVIYRYGPAVETLLTELSTARVPTLVLEPDDNLARRLFEGGQPVVQRALGDGALRSARLDGARALIANGTDDENAALILTARQLGFKGPILALVEEPYHRKPMMLAGATATFTPRHILGAALAARASQRISPRIAGIQHLGRNLEVAEVHLGPDSPLAGQTLNAAAVGSRTGATVIGQWVRGELEVLSGPTEQIEPGGTLVVVGSHDSIELLSDLAEGNVTTRRKG